MAQEARDLGHVERITADAVGVPGARRFRLRARTATDYAQLWVEREQTQGLMVAIERLLAQVQVRRRGSAIPPDPDAGVDDYPPTATIEFTVSRIGLGYDEERDLLVLELSDIASNLREEDNPSEPAEDDAVALVVRFTRGQAAALRDQCSTTLAAGRPRCTLCGAPMAADGAHFCIRSNGHRH